MVASEGSVMEIKIFQMDDCEYWMAPSEDEAKKEYMAQYGEDQLDESQVKELNDEAMDGLFYIEDWGGPDERKISFREALALRVAEGCRTECFASNEY